MDLKSLTNIILIFSSLEDIIIISGMMASGFLWPLSAWNELISGELLVSGDEVTVSPR